MQNHQYRQNQLLLLEDVINVGRKGDIVTVKPGYARNFLLPQKKAVVADKHTLKMQSKLQLEREKQAHTDREESERIKGQIEHKTYNTQVKIDPDGNLYGSVTAQDIVDILAEKGVFIDKRDIRLAHPIKSLGKHTVHVKLKEGVETQIVMQVEGDRPLLAELQEQEKQDQKQAEPAETTEATENQ